MATMRLFLAADISPAQREATAHLVERLDKGIRFTNAHPRWVRPEGMHLTLKFLGEVPDNQIVEVCRNVQEVAERHEAFDFAVQEVGSFGGRSARVLWVGAGLESPELLSLQQDLEETLSQAGWPKEARRFSGHLTLCRIRNVKAGEKLGAAAKQYEEYDLGLVRATSLCVYESQLRPQGPIYTRLGDYTLR